MFKEKASAAPAPAVQVAEIRSAKPVDAAIPATAESAPVPAPVPERREPRRDGRERELERLRKIEANYEKDKAALAREKTPALARSESHDIGHAEGSGRKGLSEREIGKMTADFQEEAIRSGKLQSSGF
ncbi:MAG: hypothetical protein LBH35_10545 [Treponema sp.]|nr:hypothetical protein [Treponema sp.]